MNVSCVRRPSVSGPFVEKAILSPLHCLRSFVKDQFIICVWVFWVFYSTLLTICLYFSPLSWCHDYFSFISLKVRWYPPPDFVVVFFRVVPVSLVCLLCLHIQFRSCLSISPKWFGEILTGNAFSRLHWTMLGTIATMWYYHTHIRMTKIQNSLTIPNA